MPSELWVTAVTRLDHEADGDLRATVVDVVPGGRVSSGRFSTLTPLVDGATGHGARVVVHAVFDPDGRSDVDASRVELIEMWRDDGRPVVDAHRDAHARAFIDAARSGLARWRWSPDTVDGEPIGGGRGRNVAAGGAGRDGA